jgi:CheY-like chemotaxis protein
MIQDSIPTHAASFDPSSVTKTILIIDDEEAIRGLLALEMGLEGYLVQEADSVDTAIAMIEQKPPDLILSDFRMPGRNGLELAEHIRSLALERQPHFMLMTGLDEAFLNPKSEEDRVEIVAKPFDLLALVRRMRDLLL